MACVINYFIHILIINVVISFAAPPRFYGRQFFLDSPVDNNTHHSFVPGPDVGSGRILSDYGRDILILSCWLPPLLYYCITWHGRVLWQNRI